MKKALLISEVFPPQNGGSGRWFWELYSRLNAEQTSIIAGQHPQSSDFDNCTALNITREDLSCWTWGIKSIDGFKFYWRNFFRIKQLIKEQNITAVHCGRAIPEGFMGYLVSKLLNLPLLCYVHGEDVEAAALSRELAWMVKLALSQSTIIICNSENTAGILANDWQINRQKISVLNPGVDANKFVPQPINKNIRTDMGWHDRKVILTVGRLQKRKGHDKLIESLPAIKQEFPNVLYAIVGGGEELEPLKSLVSQLSLEDNVVFMEEISDQAMLSCYQQCDIFILPNRTVGRDIEGFGMVLVEAQSCGKAVIAGDSGGTRETMILNKSGRIIDCTDPTVIADNMIELLSNPELLKNMGAIGRSHVVSELDWNAHVKKAENIFSRLEH